MDFALPFLLAFAITLSVTPWVLLWALRFQLVDDPKKRFHPAHTHKGIIPRAGGVSLFLGVLTATLLLIAKTPLFLGILAGSLILVVVGIIDDHHDVNPYVRLFTNAIAALVAVVAGTGIPYVTNPITGGIIQLGVLADVFAFLWIMWTMSIVGWSAGVDGQMPGFVSIAALTLGLLSLRFTTLDPSQGAVTVFAFIVAGAFAGFIPWNFYPQKIMPGYGGKTLAGFLLAILGILSYGKVGTALLVLGIPMVDAMYTLIRRIGTKRSPVWADRGHLHHRLLDLGWGKRKIALFYWGVSAILGAIALTVTSKQKLFTLLLVAVAVGGFTVWVAFFSQFSKPQDPDNG